MTTTNDQDSELVIILIDNYSLTLYFNGNYLHFLASNSKNNNNLTA